MILGNDPGPDVPWITPDLNFAFELHAPNGYSQRVTVTPQASFRAIGLRPGTYCFRVTSPLIDAYQGTIIIDPHARHDAPIVLWLKLSV